MTKTPSLTFFSWTNGQWQKQILNWNLNKVKQIEHCLHTIVDGCYYAMIFIPGGTVVALGPIVAPVLRSMTSKVVPLSERGIIRFDHS